jgi:hypothetical protein
LNATFHCAGQKNQYIGSMMRENPVTGAVQQPEMFDLRLSAFLS